MDGTTCRKCGRDIWAIAKEGKYLERVSKIGESFVGECRPSCEGNHGSQEDSLLNALEEHPPLD